MELRTCFGTYEENNPYCKSCGIRAQCNIFKQILQADIKTETHLNLLENIRETLEHLRVISDNKEHMQKIIEDVTNYIEYLRSIPIVKSDTQSSDAKEDKKPVESPKPKKAKSQDVTFVADNVFYFSQYLVPDENEVFRVKAIASELGKPLYIKKYKTRTGATTLVMTFDKKVQFYLREDGTIKYLKKGYQRNMKGAWDTTTDELFIREVLPEFKENG